MLSVAPYLSLSLYPFLSLPRFPSLHGSLPPSLTFVVSLTVVFSIFYVTNSRSRRAKMRCHAQQQGALLLVVICLGVGHGEEGKMSGALGVAECRGSSVRVRASLRGGATVGRIPLPANDTAIPAKDLEPVGSIVDEQQLTPLPEKRPMTPPPPSIFSTRMPVSGASLPTRPRSTLVLPIITIRGSVADSVGWLLALLTCSIKARKKMLLDEQLYMAAAMGDTGLCLSLIDIGSDVLAESHDGGDDPRFAFAELYGLQFYEEAERAKNAEDAGKTRDQTKSPSTKPPKRQTAARSALRWAAYNGHTDTVRALISRGADINKGDTEGYTALHEAALYGHHETLLALLELKAWVNPRTDEVCVCVCVCV